MKKVEALRQWGGWWVARLAMGLALFYGVDRLLKLWALHHFFRQPAPPSPVGGWPTVTLLSPITRGVSNLPNALACRAGLVYPAAVQHLLICDEGDGEAIACCRAWQAAHPTLASTLFVVATAERAIATKIEKLNAALPHATGDVLLFVDDDVALRPTTLTTLLPHLATARAGAVFGLACYSSWHNLPTSLMSAFVNGNALLSYVPLTYLAESFTITGHCFALRRADFIAVGGLENLDKRVDDDHELARRLRKVGLRSVQTPLIYDVENHFPSLAGYVQQMRRWFVFPQWMMVPHLTVHERMAMTAGSLSTAVPPLLALLALLTRRTTVWRALAGTLLVLNGVQWFCEHCYLGRRTPWYWWPLYSVSALLAPLQILAALLDRRTVHWRGQRLRFADAEQVVFEPDD